MRPSNGAGGECSGQPISVGHALPRRAVQKLVPSIIL
jgi:hypothetical protein